jgi:hypothetical protein
MAFARDVFCGGTSVFLVSGSTISTLAYRASVVTVLYDLVIIDSVGVTVHAFYHQASCVICMYHDTLSPNDRRKGKIS